MGRGIPPSLDRKSAQRRQAMLIGAIVLVGGGLFYLLFGAGPLAPNAVERLQSITGEATSVDNEVGTAYTATQSFVSARLAADLGQPVRWDTPRHEGHDGWYRFDGTVTVRFGDDPPREVTYEAVVVRKKKGEWTVQELSLR